MSQTRRRRVHRAPAAVLLDGLNPEQAAVVQAHEGAFKVLAGAGAGKTRSVVHRVAYLVEEHGERPQEIACVTFSKKAADEMKKRLKELGHLSGRVGTWHSLALQIIREERPDLAEWQIDTKDRFRIIMKETLGFRGMKWDTADLTVCLNYVGLCKAHLAEPGTPEAMKIAEGLFERNPCGQTNPNRLAEAYFKATEAQVQRRLLTFDDMLVGAWKILTTDPQAGDKWANRFKFVIQDEAQDSNKAQCVLAGLLAKSSGNYMIVGDPAQSIYGFRGACPEYLQTFDEEWAPVTTIRMNRNYRSGVEVIAAANRVMGCMAEGTHLGVDMLAERGTEAVVRVDKWEDMDQEGEQTAQAILEAHADGVPWKDMAVLYRTNAQSRGVEEALLSNRIPYVVIGGTNFYNRREVKDLLAYLRVAAGRGQFEDVKRCINSPFRYLGRAFTDRIERHGCGAGETWTAVVREVATQAGIQYRQKASVEDWAGLVDSITKSIEIRGTMDPANTLQDDLRPHLPAALLERIIRDTDYMRYITRDEGAETVENNRVSNVRELVRAAERFTTVKELLDYVDATIAAAKAAERFEDADRVILTTLHRSKGLEWGTVFVLGVNENILPHGRAEDIEEERRLFYVGVTRAKDRLHLSMVRQAAIGSRVMVCEPSRFLSEMEAA